MTIYVRDLLRLGILDVYAPLYILCLASIWYKVGTQYMVVE